MGSLAGDLREEEGLVGWSMVNVKRGIKVRGFGLAESRKLSMTETAGVLSVKHLHHKVVEVGTKYIRLGIRESELLLKLIFKETINLAQYMPKEYHQIVNRN